MQHLNLVQIENVDFNYCVGLQIISYLNQFLRPDPK